VHEGPSHADLQKRLAATRLALTGNIERLTESRIRLLEILEALRAGQPERDVLHELAYARLVARLDSMPVIEQAKGIVMAQSRCTADQALAILQAASQRLNVKVRDLAEQIVRRASAESPPGTPPRS
jgi:AmiR/NasT family two-component response regulator